MFRRDWVAAVSTWLSVCIVNRIGFPVSATNGGEVKTDSIRSLLIVRIRTEEGGRKDKTKPPAFASRRFRTLTNPNYEKRKSAQILAN
jgi:hypothetical protein